MQWIDNIIIGLVEEYATRNVYELCRALEIEIRYIDSSSPLLQNKEAFYTRYFDDREIIFINNDIDDKMKSFLLKHELGHALLHPSIINSSDVNSGKLEKQANYFALKLSNIEFNEIELNGMTLEQIASCLELPLEPLKQLVNI